MIIIITSLLVLFTLHFVCKKAVRKKLKAEYESSLLKGNRQRALQLGRIYYQSLTQQSKKAKGIESINKRIAQDFKAFNVISLI